MSNQAKWFVGIIIGVLVILVIVFISMEEHYKGESANWHSQCVSLTAMHNSDSATIANLNNTVAEKKSTIEAANKKLAQAQIDDSLKKEQIQYLNHAINNLKIEIGAAHDTIESITDSLKFYTVKSSVLADSTAACQRLLNNVDAKIILLQTTLCESDSAYQSVLGLLKKPVRFLLFKKYPKQPATVYRPPLEWIKDCPHVQAAAAQLKADEAKKAEEAKQQKKPRGHRRIH